MSNYKQLIQKIFNSNDENSIDAIKKLIYVAVNDPEHFSPIAPKLTKLISDSMDTTQDEELKKLFLQLLSEIATNYYQHIPASYYNFQSLINLLSDQNAEVRKASHYLLLIFIKKYEKIDEVIQSYIKKITQNTDHWKVIQKIIHSFQSLLVIQPRCITYGNDYELFDQFLEMILSFRTHSHQLIQKASDQTVTSFVKNQYTPQVLPKLDAKIMKQLVNFANKLNINITSTRQSHKNLHFQDETQQIQEVKIPQSKSKKVKHKKSILQDYLQKLETQSDWKIKLEIVQSISTQLNTVDEDEISEDLIEKILDLTSDCNFKTCITAMNIILNIVTNFSKIAEYRRDRIQDVIIDKICDLKMAVRQIANRILKKLNEKPNKIFNKKILSKLSSCSVVGKEQILNFFQESYNSTHLNDLPLILGEISTQLLNQNTRIKIKTIDCLVKLSVTNDLNQCKQILQKKLNKVYYDMYLERLKEKSSQKNQNQWGLDNQKNFNKGMTWQAQRSAPIQNTDKQFMTKVQFGNKKNNQKSNMIDTIDDFTYEKPAKKVETYQTEKKNAASIKSFSGKTANTFDTFQSQQSSGFKQNKKGFNTNSSKQSFLSQGPSFKQEQVQQKKIPLKPNPIKKKPIQNVSSKQDDELVIQSKQYINKNFEQERPSQKYQRKDERVQNSYGMKKQKIEQKQKTIAKEPFSIKKSASINKKPAQKKQHQIDYKATYYAAKQQLAPLDSLKDAIKQITAGLSNSNDWNRQFQCLNLVRRFVKNHSDSPLFHQVLATIMPEVLNLIDNLRSSLAKNAMIGLSQMCQALKKSMDPFLQPIFVKLFKKAQDANSFIVDEVRKCMTSLCYYCSAPKITSILMTNCQAKAIPVKLKIALCIDKLLQTQDYDVQRLKDNPKIVGMMGNMISDSSAQVRNMIKQTFLFLCQNNNKNQIQQIFKKTTKDAWQKFKKILQKQAKFNNMGFK